LFGSGEPIPRTWYEYLTNQEQKVAPTGLVTFIENKIIRYTPEPVEPILKEKILPKSFWNYFTNIKPLSTAKLQEAYSPDVFYTPASSPSQLK
jgi:hypothetical protein